MSPGQRVSTAVRVTQHLGPWRGIETPPLLGCRAVPGGDGEEPGLTLDGFRLWTKHHAPAVLRTLRALLSGEGATGLVPDLEGLRPITGLLQADGAWALAAALPPKQQAGVPPAPARSPPS